MSTVGACLFDIDKTIIDEQGRLCDGLDIALDPERCCFRMSVRGLTCYQEVVRGDPVLAPTQGMLVAVEAAAGLLIVKLRKISSTPLFSQKSKQRSSIFWHIPIRFDVPCFMPELPAHAVHLGTATAARKFCN